MDILIIVKAIDEARRELAGIKLRLAELDRLNVQRANLENFLLMAETVLQEHAGVRQVERQPLAEIKKLEFGADHLWDAIQFIMKVRMRPMSVNEVLEALVTEGFQVQGVHKRETVRGAMSRKEEIFEKVDRGWFALREWPEHLKKSRVGEPLQAD